MLKNNAAQSEGLYRILVDDEEVDFHLSGSEPQFGEPVVLADREDDILGHTPWYRKGFTVETLFSQKEFAGLVAEVAGKVKDLLISMGIAVPDDFVLEDYHKYVKTDDVHQKVIEVTREFRMQNFSYDFEQFIDRVSKAIGHRLKSENDEISEYSAFLIVRINRPGSNDYNPPHKDGYLPVWQRTVNLWVPIVGVTSRSSLPIVPGSHLIPENKIKRTMGGDAEWQALPRPRNRGMGGREPHDPDQHEALRCSGLFAAADPWLRQEHAERYDACRPGVEA